MQRGTIVKHHGNWTLLYYDVQFRNGAKRRVRVRKKLAAISKEHPTKTSVRHLADEVLAPLNRKQLQPESSLKLSEFIEQTYFPAVVQHLRPSTLKGYKIIFNAHLKDREQLKLRLRDFRTVHGQRLMREIPNVGHRSLLHIKSFLSGVFTFARQEGVLDGLNPMVGVKAPGTMRRFKGAAYTIEDAERMLEDILDETAQDVIVLLSLTGLRQSECRGLRWSDWSEQDQTLTISRAVWQTRVGATKNLASEDTIPVIPLLKDLLVNRRNRIRPAPNDYIFAGERKGSPLNLHNLENRIIKPALAASRAAESGVIWAGFHGFRRGLASNLFSLGVNPKVIQALLRHGDISTTLEFYVRTPDSESRAALEKLEDRIRNRPSGVVLNGIRS